MCALIELQEESSKEDAEREEVHKKESDFYISFTTMIVIVVIKLNDF